MVRLSPYLGMMSGQERAMAIDRSPQRDMCQNVGIRNYKVSLDQTQQRCMAVRCFGQFVYFATKIEVGGKWTRGEDNGRA